jgi:hypothetical protein
LGIQASQVAAIARWANKHFDGPVQVMSVGERTGLIALCAAGLEPKAISKVELHGSFASLKEIIERNMSVNQAPELFCFGLLRAFDIQHLAQLVAPRPVIFRQPTARHRKELASLKGWYHLWGKDFDPLKP